MVRFLGERSRGGGLTSTMRRFSEVLRGAGVEGQFLCRGVLSLGRGEMNNQSHS